MGGRSQQSTNSSGQGWSMNQNVAAGGSQSQSQGGSQSTGTSGSTSQSITGQNVWGPQANALQGLYGQAGNVANQDWSPYSNQFNQTTQQLMGQGQQAIAGLQGYDPQQQIAAQSASLRSGIDDMVGQQLNQLKGNAAAAGAFGGARHGLTEAAAIGEGTKAYAQGLGDITATANQQGIAANTAIGSMLPSLQQMQGNTGTYAQGLAMNPLTSLASIYGQGPTTLSYGQSGSNAFSNQQSTSFSNSLSQALNYALGQGFSGNTNQSQGDASSWNIDNFLGTFY